MMGLKTLFETLKPEFFDNLVSATKIISGYDPSSRTDIATRMIIKKSKLIICHNQEECLTNIKRLKHLIENHWTLEISSLKPKLLPLTSDVMKFQKYLVKEAKEASENILKKHKLVKEYRRLSENVLAMVVFLYKNSDTASVVNKTIDIIRHITVDPTNSLRQTAIFHIYQFPTMDISTTAITNEKFHRCEIRQQEQVIANQVKVILRTTKPSPATTNYNHNKKRIKIIFPKMVLL
ncbi:hypothetical protein RN001_013425 [Aquatica leii]|uniref:Uncharacterized protein n=1 Tax=Aquatica leii TaxID=1421715 RepID=A0AAN7SNQ7_9COLE|nr:hypothetical protein RN001_013425 [Aquatica leii]